MERLTVDTDLVFCDIAQCECSPGGVYCPDGYCDQRRCYERLREYEATGLTPEQVKAQKWISVKDGLPIQNIDNSSGDCLIAIKYAYDLPDEERSLCSGYLLDGEWWSYGDHSCHKIGDKNTNDEGDVVTHWMPLPEPPKEAHDD